MLATLPKRVEQPTATNNIEFYTDGNDDYVYKIPKFFNIDYMNYGQLIKIKQGGRVIDKKKRMIYGNPNLKDVETTDVENFNGILRERMGILVRKTKCFSKKKCRLEKAIHVFQFYWNFINEFKRSTSPAMIEGISNHLWTWSNFLMFHYAV